MLDTPPPRGGYLRPPIGPKNRKNAFEVWNASGISFRFTPFYKHHWEGPNIQPLDEIEVDTNNDGFEAVTRNGPRVLKPHGQAALRLFISW